MGRPEPCVLYAHTLVHPQLDEYVDEVLFSEPVVVTACEFLEQNVPSSCSAVKLVGEARFRRLCLPLLYSQSSSNILEIEAIVTSHLIVRGSYRSLSMVVYGNTAEDLGQFNIEVDLDSSLTNTVSTIGGNEEDLPSAFRLSALTIKEFVSPLHIISPAVAVLELSLELRKFLLLAFKILDSSNLEEAADKVISLLLSVTSTCVCLHSFDKASDIKKTGVNRSVSGEDVGIFSELNRELWDVAKMLQNWVSNSSNEVSERILEMEDVNPTSKELISDLNEHFDIHGSTFGYSYLSQTKNMIIWLSVARLLCSARESCFHFVNSGGMEHLMEIFTDKMKNSASLQLMLLGVIDQATQHSIGCEGFLGWWPRGDEAPPARTSDGYNQVFKLLLESQRHDIASLATQMLNRVRFYEVACGYEHSVLSILGDLHASNQVMNSKLDFLTKARGHLQKLSKLLCSGGPIDDPSPLATARRHLIAGDDCQLTYESTVSMIDQSSCRFLSSKIDSRLLSLLKERGFLPLSAALLSSLVLHSEAGHSMDSFLDVVLQIEGIIIVLLFCRSGLDFLLHEPEVFSAIVYALRGVEDIQKEASLSVRYASILVSKGFFCPPQEVGFMLEMHMTVLCAVDRLCNLTPGTDEFLWVLWDLCHLSRSECGRQAMLVMVNFPEAIIVLMNALSCGKQLGPTTSNTGISPLNLAIVHSAAEIFEVIVSDSTVASFKSWIDLANELHTALHSSSPGSNKKDSPARLLEWIDAGVVYHRNGVIGLLRYAAVLVSGGDVHMTANSVLSSDAVDVDNMVGDSSNGSYGNVIDNLIGKRITEKDFAGVVLHDSSITQLATALRILAFLSDNQVVAAALYDEGAVMVVHAVIINCGLMLERSSNVYDFLVDDGMEGSSTSDFIMERSREKCLLDLLISSLVLLVNLLQKLKSANEQHRNKNIMNALLQLHREVSSKLVVSTAELSQSYPEVAPSIAAVCRLLASALAFWPVYGWTPGLVQFLLDNLHANSLLALGPKDACSLFCLLNDLLPNEGTWRWKSGIPMLYPLRAISVGSILGPEKERQVNWYLIPGSVEKLLSSFFPKLEKLGEVILHCAISMSVILQDLVRVFVIRMACLNLDYASLLVKPVISWVSNCLSGSSTLSDADVYKVNQLLNFLAVMLEHPSAKPIFLKEGGLEMLTKVLERCIGVNCDMKQHMIGATPANKEFFLFKWCNPVFQSISLISDCSTSFQYHGVCESNITDSLTTEESSICLSYLLRFLQILPFGTELLNCISSFNEIIMSSEGQTALLSIVKHAQPSTIQGSKYKTTHQDHVEWNDNPPLLSCWTTLLKSIDIVDAPIVQIASTVNKLASGVLRFCIDGESVSIARVSAIKFLFRINHSSALEDFVKVGIKNVEKLINLMGNEMPTNTSFWPQDILKAAHLFLHLLQKSTDNEVDATVDGKCRMLLAPPFRSKIRRLAHKNMERIDSLSLEVSEDAFSWEFPENLRNRLTQTSLPMKRKASLEGSNRHARGENATVEVPGSFPRGAQPMPIPTGLTRRDAFRQRKPNTSRPPSMHVDDYVARERNVDGTNVSNAVAVPRLGSSGRPPSVHVDVFMTRQSERQGTTQGLAVGDAGHVKPVARDENLGAEKSSEPQKLRSDLDDDLQGIDIVFDGESDETDERPHFIQPDDNLQQPAFVAIDLQSPHSMVEETDGDAHETSQFSRMGENALGNYSSRMPTSQIEMPLSQQQSVSSHKKYPEKPMDVSRYPTRTSDAIDTASGAGAQRSVPSSMPLEYHTDPRLPTTLYPETPMQQSGTLQLAAGMQSYYDQKIPSGHLPIPSMPPLHAAGASLMSQNRELVKPVTDAESHAPLSFLGGKFQSDYMSTSSTAFVASVSSPDMFGRKSSSGFASSRSPLAPIPQYSPNSSIRGSMPQTGPYMQATGNSEIQQTVVAPTVDSAANLPTSRSLLNSYPPPPPIMQQSTFRPGSIPTGHHGSGFHGDLPGQIAPSMLLVQPLQPPLIHQPQPQHLGPSIPAFQHSEQQRLSLLQGSLPILNQSTQVLQQVQPSPAFWNTPRLPGEGTSHQQDPAMSLQEYFRSPEAIQHLVSDPDKLCQLLEQHPKLLEMLQDRLAQQ